MKVACLLVAVLLCHAVPASAWTGCGTTSSSSAAAASLSPNGARVLCHDTETATATDSGILSVTACGHIEIAFSPSYANGNSGAEAQIYSCFYETASTTTCDKLLVDTDGDGMVTSADDVTLDGITYGRQGQQWQTADWIFVDMTVAPGAGDVARTKVTCHH